MPERIHSPAQTLGPDAPSQSLFNAPADSHSLATVSCGPYVERLPVGRLSIGDIRRRFSSRMDIDPHSQAILDGREVDDATVVGAGQALMFTRRTGEKGAYL